MRIIRLSWLRLVIFTLMLSFFSFTVRAEYYVVTTPCCVTPAFKYYPKKQVKKHHYVKRSYDKKPRHIHTNSCGHYSFSGSSAYGSYNVTVYEFYQAAPCCACGMCAASCSQVYNSCGKKRSFETRYGYPTQDVHERYREECYDPDLSTGDDNACTHPDMQIN